MKHLTQCSTYNSTTDGDWDQCPPFPEVDTTTWIPSEQLLDRMIAKGCQGRNINPGCDDLGVVYTYLSDETGVAPEYFRLDQIDDEVFITAISF